MKNRYTTKTHFNFIVKRFIYLTVVDYSCLTAMLLFSEIEVLITEKAFYLENKVDEHFDIFSFSFVDFHACHALSTVF